MENIINTPEHKFQTLAVALSDASFLKQYESIEGKDAFDTTPNQWFWDEIRKHYQKYGEQPTLEILEQHANGIESLDLKPKVLLNFDEVKKHVTQPPSNIQWLKDQFNVRVSKQRFDNALARATDMAKGSTEKAEAVLKDYFKSGNIGSEKNPLKPITAFKRPEPNDPSELIKFRFLCRGRGIILIGPSGVGKSTLSTQLAISWGAGKGCLGLNPTGPLKSLIIQAEDDAGDIGDMAQSVLQGLKIEPGSADEQWVTKNVMMPERAFSAGDKFIKELDAVMTEFKPDIVWINPVLSFLGGDANSQKDVSHFLRNGLSPVLEKHNAGCVLVHHTAKPPKDKAKQGWSGGDFQYAGLGSVEWAGWARGALIIVTNRNSADVYTLRAGKRASALGWKDALTGENTIDKFISHSKEPRVLYWTETDRDAIAALSTESNESNATYTSLLKHIPFEPSSVTRQEVVSVSGVSDKTVDRYLKKMIAKQEVSILKKGKLSIYTRAMQTETGNKYLDN
jgi:hypothetical protein